MKSIINTILIVLGIIAAILLYRAYSTDSKIVLDPKELIDKVDSLNKKVNVLQEKKDSTKTRIDTLVVRIKENNIKHEKISNTIVSNTPTDDYLFFTEYINSNSSRLDSIYNL